MSKKQINKKKLNLKLVIGESAVVLNYETFLHIAETYDYLGSLESEQDAQIWYRDVADAIRYQAGFNHFLNDEEYEEW
jgi:hypothetical protein